MWQVDWLSLAGKLLIQQDPKQSEWIKNISPFPILFPAARGFTILANLSATLKMRSFCSSLNLHPLLCFAGKDKSVKVIALSQRHVNVNCPKDVKMGLEGQEKLTRKIVIQLVVKSTLLVMIWDTLYWCETIHITAVFSHISINSLTSLKLSIAFQMRWNYIKSQLFHLITFFMIAVLTFNTLECPFYYILVICMCKYASSKIFWKGWGIRNVSFALSYVFLFSMEL